MEDGSRLSDSLESLSPFEELPPELLVQIVEDYLDPVSSTCLALSSLVFYDLLKSFILKSYSFTNVMVSHGSVRMLQWALDSKYPLSFVEVLKQSCLVGDVAVFDWAVQAIQLENKLMEDNIFLTSLCNMASRHNQVSILEVLRLRYQAFPSTDMVEDFPHAAVLNWYAEHAIEWDLSNATIIERAAEINAPETLTFMKKRHCHINNSSILYPAAKNGHIAIIDWAAKNDIVPDHFDYGYYFQRALSFLKLEAAKHFYSLGVSINKATFIRAIMLPLIRNRTKSMDKIVTTLKYLVEELDCEIDDSFHTFAARFPSPEIIRFGYHYHRNLSKECFYEALRSYRRSAVKNNDYSSYFLGVGPVTILVDESPLHTESLSVFQFLIDSDCPKPSDLFLFCLKELIYFDMFTEDPPTNTRQVEDETGIEVFYHTQIFQLLAFLVGLGVTPSQDSLVYVKSAAWERLEFELKKLLPTE